MLRSRVVERPELADHQSARGPDLRRRLLVAALLSVGLLASSQPPVFADGSSLGFSPEVVAANPGDSFSVDVLITVDQEIRGAQFGLQFDPSAIQVSSVSEGSFLKDWARAHHGQSAAAVPFQVDNNRGEVSIGGIILLGGDSNGGPSGTGVLATVKGTVKPGATAGSPLALTAVKFASSLPDSSGVPNVSVLTGQVSVGGAVAPAPPATTDALPPPATTDMAPPADAPPDDSGAQSNPGAASGPPVVGAHRLAFRADVFMQADPDAELPPIVVPTSAPVFSSDLDRQAAAVAAEATANALQSAIVAVTPPSLQQPQPPAAALPTPAPVATPPATANVGSSANPPVANVTAVARSVNQALRPTGSAGVFIPWEVIAGIGAGIVSAGLILTAFRGSSAQQPHP